MTDNPYRATRHVEAVPPLQPGRAWRIAANVTRLLAIYLLIDSAFSLMDQRTQRTTPRASRCPTLYLGLQELLAGASPRAVLLVPPTVCLLRVTSTATALALVTGAAIRIVTRGAWRIRTPQLIAILLCSALLGALAAAWNLVSVLGAVAKP